MPLFARKPQVDAVLECPHDGNAMEKRQVAGVLIDQCGSCGGTWFDAKELRRVAHDRELEALAARLPLVKMASPFRCPRCDGECVEGNVSEVGVDTCTACHGVWLDRGELAEATRLLHAERVLAAAAPGFRTFLSRL